MKAIILAAGRGSRMMPLTTKIPKPMVTVHGIPILEHIINIFPKEIDEIILVTGYLEDKIKNYFGTFFRNKIKINYITQEKFEGTWKALKLAEKYVNKDESFLLVFADDMHGKKGIEEMVKYDNSILVCEHVSPEKFGVVETDQNNNVISIEEKPVKPKTNLVSTGVYVLESKIFAYQDPEPVNGEYYLPYVFNEYLKGNKIKVVHSDMWLAIGTPQDVMSAHEHKIFDY